MSVVSAVEFEDDVAFGGGSGESECGHCGFGSGVYEADHLDGWDGVGDDFCGGDFDFGWCAERCAACGGILSGFGDLWVSVSEYEGTPGAYVVDVLVAVGVGDFGSVSGGEEQGVAADGSPCSGGAVDAAGYEFGGGLV